MHLLLVWNLPYFDCSSNFNWQLSNLTSRTAERNFQLNKVYGSANQPLISEALSTYMCV